MKILLVDNQVLVRKALKALLAADGIEIAGEAQTVEEALEANQPPDVIIFDPKAAPGTTVSLVKRLQIRYPDAAILLLPMIGRPFEVRPCLAAGARGYVPKTASPEELLDAIRALARGEDYLHPSLGAAMARGQPRRFPGSQELTDKEREVLSILALGYTNAEVAALLSLAVRTIETHRANIMDKLRLASRAELVRYAIANGLLDVDQQSERLGA